MMSHIENALENYKAVKWYLLVKVILEKEVGEGEVEAISTYFRSFNFSEFSSDFLTAHLDAAYQKINRKLDEFVSNGSGWVLKEVAHFELKIAKLNPLRGASYLQLPQVLEKKKAILNIKNTNDDKCFLWSVLAHLHPVSHGNHANRVSKYREYEDEIQMGGVCFPVPYSQVPVIEELNDLRINVFGFGENEIYILYVSDREDEDVINLLLIGDGDTTHYCLIRHFSRFVAHRTNYHAMHHYCYRCLHAFVRRDLLDEHVVHCKKHAAQHVKFPKEGENLLSFTGTHLQHKVAFTIYADFESILKPIDSCTPSSKKSFQEKQAQHIACGFSYVIIDSKGQVKKPAVVYRGENAVDHFLEAMMKEQKILGRILKSIQPMRLTEAEEKAFMEATHCSICKKPLGNKRHREHDHLDGSYRGAAHGYCNINYKQSKVIPILFHNLKSYDGHHLMTRLGKYPEYKIDVIAQTMEKYISFKLKKEDDSVQLKFIDSFHFLPTSLDKLAQNQNDDDFKILKSHFPNSEDFNLLKKKGVYPYEYFDTLSKFSETQLPPKSAFFSSLTQEFITDEDYAHACKVWSHFNMQTLGGYHDLYVKTDVLLLADIFENFRNLCMRYYDLDPAHMLTLPGLSWQACLKMTQVQLELLTEPDMLLFIESGIRGGVSQISHRLATANNPELPNYKPEEETSSILYLDANNLYGWAMSQYMPHGGFEWVDTDEFYDVDQILNLKDDADEGFIFEVDLLYPEELHDSHNEYPLAPERLTVDQDMLSPYAMSLLYHPYKGTPKLIPNLRNKEKYIVHYRNLKLYLQLGLKCTHIHKILKFNQSPWLKNYIDFNTQKRAQATSSFEKDFFKLLNNSIYGKTMENLRKHRNIELCNNPVRAEKLIASPNYKNFKIFDENLVAVERQKSCIMMNRPIYVGFAILELSKVLMFDFHYNTIKQLFGSRATLLFTDTDSLCYYIKTSHLNQKLKTIEDKFDTSEHPINHPLYSITNKKIVGKFKDELHGEPAIQFIGIKAKMYSIKTEAKEKKRAKGVPNQIVQKKLTHEDYLQCITSEKTSYEASIKIGQDHHRLYTLCQNKKCLSPFDDKRYLLEDGISSLAYGHYKIHQDASPP